jgi:hypothetical protein
MLTGGTLLLLSTFLFYGCAIIISSTCELSAFEGVYAGKYNVGGLIPIPVEDTIVVVVDLDNNTALLTSVLLDTSFVATFQPSKNQLIIGALDIPVFNLGDNQLFGITVDDGYSTLDGECNKLFLQMNNVSVQDHTFVGFPKPINNLDLTTPNFMRRLQ